MTSISLIIHTPTNIALENGKLYVRAAYEEWQVHWPLHTHQGLEVYYFIQGQAHYLIGDAIYELLPGDMLLFRGDVIHRVNPSGQVPYVRSYLNFMPDFLAEVVPEDLFNKLLQLFNSTSGLRIRWLPEEREEIERMYSIMEEEAHKEAIGHAFVQKTLLAQLLIHVYRKSKYLVEMSPPSAVSTTQMTVQRILQFVNQTYRENESLDDMAKRLHLSKYYMCHCFKEVTGYTINSYVMRKRVEDAKKMLLEGEESVADISEWLGFNSAIHFSRTFKQYAGVPPLVFRKSR